MKVQAPKELSPVLTFPVEGLDLSQGYQLQRKNTTASDQNVRTYDPLTDRARGGTRGGLKKLQADQISAHSVQELNSIDLVADVSNLSGRKIVLVAVCNGDIVIANGTGWLATTGGSAALSTSATVVRSTNHLGTMYFVDGTNYKKYVPSTNVTSAWTASAGSMPISGTSKTARLITTWRDRVVLGGIFDDPYNWFMSKYGVADNFDYSTSPVVETMATSGTAGNTPNGQMHDIITSFIPWNDDVMLCLCSTSIWQFTGDPMAGGRIDLVTRAIGGTWGTPWCMDPLGNVFFFSNHCGLFRMAPGGMPERISTQIDSVFASLDTEATVVRLAWEDRFQALHVFLTPVNSATDTAHYFWEQRSGSWHKDYFANLNHNPVCCHTFMGADPTTRRVVIGGRDGYVRYFDTTTTTDDGTTLTSFVFLGPFTSKDLSDLSLETMKAVLGASSNTVTWGVYLGRTAEQALASTAVLTGTWPAGRDLQETYIHRSGYAIYVKISGTTPWQLEQLRCKLRVDLGKVRGGL